MKNFLFLFVLLFCFSAVISAQKPLEISGGVVNGKAITLVRPPYPAAARAVNASGSVKVQVLIDYEGNVISAVAVSGHPLLYSVSVKAALASKFSPTFLQGQPVKVSGIIVYNFVGSTAPKTLSEVGFTLGILEKAETVPFSISINELADNLPAEWTEEKSKFMDFYAENNNFSSDDAKKTPASKTKSSKNKSKNYETRNRDRAPVIMGMALKAEPSTSTMTIGPKELSPERSKISAELIGMIEKRLETDTNLSWKFKTGTVLGRIAAQNNDEMKLQAEASNLSKFIATAPADVSALKKENMGKLLVLLQSGNITEERKVQIKTLANSLKSF